METENDRDISNSGISFLMDEVLKYKQAGSYKSLSVHHMGMHCTS